MTNCLRCVWSGLVELPLSLDSLQGEGSLSCSRNRNVSCFKHWFLPPVLDLGPLHREPPALADRRLTSPASEQCVADLELLCQLLPLIPRHIQMDRLSLLPGPRLEVQARLLFLSHEGLFNLFANDPCFSEGHSL